MTGMLDTIDLYVHGGNGGNGSVSFRHEKFIARGGPDGGNGGVGGDVVLMASGGVDSLEEFSRQRQRTAESGNPGGGSRSSGKQGAALVLPVPVGTVVTEVGAEYEAPAVVELVENGQRVVVAQGGRGGRGNATLATSVRRTPRFALRGQPGEERRIRLEVRIVADVGLVGQPNAGKSLLLSRISAARPRSAPFAFTTTRPVRGVVDRGGTRWVAVEVPGLVAGAHEGRGMGLDFLRHLARTRVLLHIIDAAAERVEERYREVREEIERHGGGLEGRSEIIALNKVDLVSDRGRLDEVRHHLEGRGHRVRLVSAQTGEGVDALLGDVAAELAVLCPLLVESVAPVLRPRAEQAPAATREEEGVIRLVGSEALRLAQAIDPESRDALAYVRGRLRRGDAGSALRRAGVRAGERVRVGELELVWE